MSGITQCLLETFANLALERLGQSGRATRSVERLQLRKAFHLERFDFGERFDRNMFPSRKILAGSLYSLISPSTEKTSW